jgi:hypothetical protein
VDGACDENGLDKRSHENLELKSEVRIEGVWPEWRCLEDAENDLPELSVKI